MAENIVINSTPVITWSTGGYGSGTSRQVFIDGQYYGTEQIPESYSGRDDAYIQSRYPQYKTQEQLKLEKAPYIAPPVEKAPYIAPPMEKETFVHYPSPSMEKIVYVHPILPQKETMPFSIPQIPSKETMPGLPPMLPPKETMPIITDPYIEQMPNLVSKPSTPVNVMTWTGSGYGSGTSRTLYADGKYYGTMQIPESYSGRDEAYIQSQVSKFGYMTPSQVTAQQQATALAAEQARAAEERAYFAAHDAQQANLLSGFQGAVASGEIRSISTPGLPIGVEAFKASEKASALEKSLTQISTPAPIISAPIVGVEAMKVAEKQASIQKTEFAQSLAGTTKEEAAAISKMLQSPTATFASQETMQKGYDIVQGKGLSLSPEQVKANIYVPTPKVETISNPIGQTDSFGMPKLSSLPTIAPTTPGKLGFYPSMPGSVAEKTAQEKVYATRESESFTTPLLKPTEDISKYIQSGVDRILGVTAKTSPGIATGVSGVASVFTGLPSFLGQGVFAAEQLSKPIDVYGGKVSLPGLKLVEAIVGGAPLFVSQTKQSAVEDPFRFGGSLVGMIALGEAGKVPKVIGKGTEYVRNLEPASGIKSFREVSEPLITEFNKPSLQSQKITLGREQLVEPLLSEWNKPSLQVQKQISATKISAQAVKELSVPSSRIGDFTAGMEVARDIGVNTFLAMKEPSLQSKKFTLGRTQVIDPLTKILNEPSLQSLKVTAGREQVVEPLITELKTPSSRLDDYKAAKEVIGGYKTDIKSEWNKPSEISLQRQKVISGKDIFSELDKELSRPSSQVIRQTEATKAAKEIINIFGEPSEQVIKIGAGKETLVDIGKGIKKSYESPTGRYKPEIKTFESISKKQNIDKFGFSGDELGNSGIGRFGLGEKYSNKGIGKYGVQTEEFTNIGGKNPIKSEYEMQPQLPKTAKARGLETSEKARDVSGSMRPLEKFTTLPKIELVAPKVDPMESFFKSEVKSEPIIEVKPKEEIVVKNKASESQTPSTTFDIGNFGIEGKTFPTMPKSGFGELGKGSRFGAQPKQAKIIPVKKGTEPPAMRNIFSDFRESMSQKETPLIEISAKKVESKGFSVVDKRKVKPEVVKTEPEGLNLNVKDDFFAEENKFFEIPKETRKIEYRPKPKETTIDVEKKTSTGQILIQKQIVRLKEPELLKPLEQKQKTIEITKAEEKGFSIIDKRKVKTQLKEEQKLKPLEQKKYIKEEQKISSSSKIFPLGIFASTKEKVSQGQKQFVNSMVGTTQKTSIFSPTKTGTSIITKTPTIVSTKTPERVVEKTSTITPTIVSTITPIKIGTITKTTEIQKEIKKLISPTIQIKDPLLYPILFTSGKDAGKKKRKIKNQFGYKGKTRKSPIFEGAEHIFENAPESPLGTRKTTPRERKQVKPILMIPNFGLDVGNPLREKTNKIKSKKTKTKNEFWKI